MSAPVASSAASISPLAGDRARRRAALGLVLSCAGALLTWVLFARLDVLWSRVDPLEGTVFLLAATALGAALALAPLCAIVGLIGATWFGVESVYRPRRQASPLLDCVIVGSGLLVWFAPALACLAVIARALHEGRVHFVRPPRDYFLATDPIAFWQSIGFWLIMAVIAGFLAWRYWRDKLRSPRALRP